MQKVKIKFYEPTVQQFQNQKMNQVFQMLKKQQEGISALLKKYQYQEEQNPDQYFSHKSRHVKKTLLKQKEEETRKSKSLNKSTLKSKILLPQIKFLSKKNERIMILSDKRKKKNSQTIEVEKTSLRKQLEQIYQDRKDQKQLRENSRRKGKSMRKNDSIAKSRLASQNSTMLNYFLNRQKSVGKKQKINMTNPYMNDNRQNSQNSILKPTGIDKSLMLLRSKDIASEPSDSQQEEIPLIYYQRQFKSKMTTQCLQETNYLYFSKNESIKDWSESLLTMFEKHDKQIVSLRKKMKYLETFDDKFFATDIYKNQ